MRKSLLLVLILCTGWSTRLAAQSARALPVSQGVVQFTRAEVGSVADAHGAVPLLIAQTPRVKMAHDWNEREGLLRLSVRNTFRAPLLVEGVQTSGSLYVVSYPEQVAVGASGELAVRYAAGTAGDGAVDTITLLTNQGVKTIEVEHDREPVFELDKTQLAWTAGDRSVQTAYLVTIGQTTTPAGVAVLGGGNAVAKLEKISATQYAIKITPGGPGKFVIRVDFAPPVAGAVAIIYCEVNG